LCRVFALACSGALGGTTRIRAHDQKGLRDRNSPTCTLSQNGYGDFFARPKFGHTSGRGLWKKVLPKEVVLLRPPNTYQEHFRKERYVRGRVAFLSIDLVRQNFLPKPTRGAGAQPDVGGSAGGEPARVPRRPPYFCCCIGLGARCSAQALLAPDWLKLNAPTLWRHNCRCPSRGEMDSKSIRRLPQGFEVPRCCLRLIDRAVLKGS
jgi:hypothetical protein